VTAQKDEHTAKQDLSIDGDGGIDLVGQIIEGVC
jgi:hypothetical protein